MDIALTKPWNGADLYRPDFQHINQMFDRFFGKFWPQVPLRRWEYVAAIVFTGILSHGPDYKVLEAGAGCSVFTPFLAKQGFKVHCSDVGMLSERRARDRQLKIEENVIEQTDDLRNLGYDNNQFDYIFCISAIEHVNAGRFATELGDFGDDKAMSELYRVLKPGGIIFLTTDYADRYYPPPGLWDTGSHRIYDALSLQRLIANAGFEYIGKQDFNVNAAKLKDLEPKKYAYTTFAITLKKPL